MPSVWLQAARTQKTLPHTLNLNVPFHSLFVITYTSRSSRFATELIRYHVQPYLLLLVHNHVRDC